MKKYLLFNFNENKPVFVNKDDVLDKLYYLECRMIVENDGIDAETIKKTKNAISKIDNKVPLYDTFANNIFLIDKYDVYERVNNQYYRFPDKKIIKEIKTALKNHKYKSNDELEKRTFRKLTMMNNFMSYFNLKILYRTYIYVFYTYSKYVGEEILTCKRKSFLPQFYHIKPYFTKTEIINMSKNIGEINVNESQLNTLCKLVRENEIGYDILLAHKKYMIKTGSLGLIQYYTLQGSGVMNPYMRNMGIYKNTRSEYFDKMIKPMWNLVLNAPEFNNKYTFYRFVKTDDYLQNLKIGDSFMENGFMSTTRNPFYKSEFHQFGFILLKINVPVNRAGVALCLETISHFPEEQEIIFPPRSIFKLIKKDENCIYYHTDEKFNGKIKTKYEFDWIENKPINFIKTNSDFDTEMIDFLKIKKSTDKLLRDKINYFEATHVNRAKQFSIKLGNVELVVLTEKYDSTKALKNFYAIGTTDGYALYAFYNNYILFFIELGTINDQTCMHVNYCAKYNSIDIDNKIKDDDLMLFYSSVAYYFGVYNVTIYANYKSCDMTTTTTNNTITRLEDGDTNSDINVDAVNIESENDDTNTKLFGGSYCVDFYQYITSKTKKYADINVLNIELKSTFSYFDLDLLKTISPNKILEKNDNEIYQVYTKLYKNTKNNDNICDFYVWLKETRCYLIDKLVDSVDKILGAQNPFKNASYKLDPITYLYNRKYIATYPLLFQ